MNVVAHLLMKIRTPKHVVDKCIKSPVSDDPSTSDIVNGPKHH